MQSSFKMRITNCVCFFLLVFNACTGSFSQDHSTNVTKEDLENIQEAVFKYVFQNNESGIKTKASTYCISVSKRDQDPNLRFMERFKLHLPPVKPASSCYFKRVTGDPIGILVDKTTEKPALLFYIEAVDVKRKQRAVVQGGYMAGSADAAATTYFLEKKRNKWMVIKEKLKAIS